MEKETFKSKRIVIVGSESTGKTTLAKKLVDYFKAKGDPYSNTQWVEEYGREYTYEKLAKLANDPKRDVDVSVGMDQLVWTEDDFIHIGKIQNIKEDQAAKISGPILICDTDAFATAIWHERYMKTWSSRMETIISQMKPRLLYLLCDHQGAKFQQDEIRDGEHLRQWMTERFEQEMINRKFSYIKLSGSYEKRIIQAIDEIEKKIIE